MRKNYSTLCFWTHAHAHAQVHENTMTLWTSKPLISLWTLLSYLFFWFPSNTPWPPYLIWAIIFTPFFTKAIFFNFLEPAFVLLIKKTIFRWLLRCIPCRGPEFKSKHIFFVSLTNVDCHHMCGSYCCSFGARSYCCAGDSACKKAPLGTTSLYGVSRDERYVTGAGWAIVYGLFVLSLLCFCDKPNDQKRFPFVHFCVAWLHFVFFSVT